MKGKGQIENRRCTSAVVEVIGARKEFENRERTVKALDGMDFTAYAGQVVGILGTNGSGKTTLVRAIAGIIELDAGVIKLFSRSLNDFSARDRAESIGLVQQSPIASLCPGFSVGEMVSLYIDEKERDSVRDILAKRGLSFGQRVDQLSGGQKQLLALDLVLGRSPKILLLDEPTASLDSENAKALLKRVSDVREAEVAVLLVSHAIEEALEISDRLIFMHKGRGVYLWEGRELERLKPRVLRQFIKEESLK